MDIRRDAGVDAMRAAQIRGERMRIWGKTAEKVFSGRGVVRAALDGASRRELLQEALKAPMQRAG